MELGSKLSAQQVCTVTAKNDIWGPSKNLVRVPEHFKSYCASEERSAEARRMLAWYSTQDMRWSYPIWKSRSNTQISGKPLSCTPEILTDEKTSA